jgi:hypothetical protein
MCPLLHERQLVRPSTSTFTSRTLRVGVVGLAVLSLAGLSACSDDDKSSSTTAAEVAPEDIKVAPAVVIAGMTKLPTTIATAIAAIGTDDVDAKVDAIEEEWASFEGTVKDTDQDLYLAIEDQLDPLQEQIKNGDSATATATAAKMSAIFDQYKVKYPG